MNERLLDEATRLVPGDVVLRPGDAALDPVYGGRVADQYGAPAWAYYSTKIGPDTSGGTTCSTVLAYLMSRAGWPMDMIDRAPTDPVAPGGGFTPGMSMSKIVYGAKHPPKRSGRSVWYLDAPVEPLLGDAYHVDHPPKANSDHVGVVVRVGDRAADGTREIVTIDGGAGSGADVQRQTRVLSADGRTLTLILPNGVRVPARMLGVIRAKEEAIA